MNILIILVTILLPLLFGYILGRNRDNSKILFSKKLTIYSEIIYEINSHKYLYKNDLLKDSENPLGYIDKLIKLFAPARLLGSTGVVNELREYFSLVSEYYTTKDEALKNNIANKISKSAMELEQLMRKDLGRFRHLSKIDLWWHHRRKS